MSKAQETFAKIYAELVENQRTSVSFEPKWNNGTGYLDGAVSAEIRPGTTATTTTDNNRRVILIGTDIGTVAVFERYSAKENGERSSVIVANAPRALGAITDGSLSAEIIDLLVGNPNKNISDIVRNIRSS